MEPRTAQGVNVRRGWELEGWKGEQVELGRAEGVHATPLHFANLRRKYYVGAPELGLSKNAPPNGKRPKSNPTCGATHPFVYKLDTFDTANLKIHLFDFTSQSENCHL